MITDAVAIALSSVAISAITSGAAIVTVLINGRATRATVKDVKDTQTAVHEDTSKQLEVIRKDVNSGLTATKEALAAANRQIAEMASIIARQQEQMTPSAPIQLTPDALSELAKPVPMSPTLDHSGS